MVYAPILKTFWHAVKGGGAYKNGKPIHVSFVDQMIESLAITGFACVRGSIELDNLPLFNKVIYKVQAVRRFGSAAIDLCHLAEGHAEIFWELNLNSYDIAAGELILREAGGKVTCLSGTSEFESRRQILASNGLVHDAFLKLVPSQYKISH